jgi:hypothetical protein
MATGDFNLSERLRDLFANVKLEDITDAVRRTTLAEITHLFDMAKECEFNTATVTRLYEEARKLPSTGTIIAAATLVISVINFYYPMAAITPLLTALGFIDPAPAPGMDVCKPRLLTLLTLW